MNIGPFQIVWWSPIEIEHDDDEATLAVARIRRPQFWAERESLCGVYRWRVVVGWLDVRRFATEAEMAAFIAKRRGADDAAVNL